MTSITQPNLTFPVLFYLYNLEKSNILVYGKITHIVFNFNGNIDKEISHPEYLHYVETLSEICGSDHQLKLCLNYLKDKGYLKFIISDFGSGSVKYRDFEISSSGIDFLNSEINSKPEEVKEIIINIFPDFKFNFKVELSLENLISSLQHLFVR
jgi:hypothetical protein